MKILILSDIHNGIESYPNINPDLVLLLGDINWREIEKIDKKYLCKKLGVLGNHDRNDTFDRTSIENIHRKKVEINGFTIGGFEGSPIYTTKDIPQHTEKEAKDYMDSLSYVDIFIAHSNPMWEMKQNEKESHRGFNAFTNYILKKQPLYFIHGHLHESNERKVGKTNVISVYPFLIIEIK